MVFFLQQLVQGLALGSIYGLIAIGYVLIYNTWGVLNFAQGDMVMVGAFTVLVTYSMWGLPMYLAIPVAVVLCVIIGYLIELTAFRPLLNAENQRRLIATIGVAVQAGLAHRRRLVDGGAGQPISSEEPAQKAEKKGRAKY